MSFYIEGWDISPSTGPGVTWQTDEAHLWTHLFTELINQGRIIGDIVSQARVLGRIKGDKEENPQSDSIPLLLPSSPWCKQSWGTMPVLPWWSNFKEMEGKVNLSSVMLFLSDVSSPQWVSLVFPSRYSKLSASFFMIHFAMNFIFTSTPVLDV